MWLNIFKISIILSVTATALSGSIFKGILTALKEKYTNALTYGDKLLLEVLAKGVVGMPDTSTSAYLDEALHDEIIKFLIEYQKRNLCPPLDDSLLQYMYNGLNEAGMPYTSTATNLDKVLSYAIVKFLIEHPKGNVCTSLDDSLFQYTYDVLFEHSERTTASFIRLWGKSYYLSDKMVTWYEANKTCVDMGASLISQEKNDERTLLFRFLNVNFDVNWWVSFDIRIPEAVCPLLTQLKGIDPLLIAVMQCHYLSRFICEK